MPDANSQKKTPEEEELERQREILRKQQELNSQLLEAILKKSDKELKRLLYEEGASPNATCQKTLKSACHIAAFMNWEALRTLLQVGADRFRRDKHGLTPMDHAIKGDGRRRIAMLLDFPSELAYKCALTITPAIEEEIKAFRPMISEDNIKQLNPTDEELRKPTGIELNDIIKEELVTEESDFKKDLYRLPHEGQTTSVLLHWICSSDKHATLKVLLAVGIDLSRIIHPSLALDLAGTDTADELKLHYTYRRRWKTCSESKREDYIETVKALLSYGFELQTNSKTFDTILRKAAEMKCLDRILAMLGKAGVLTLQNTENFTPIEICEWNNLDMFKKILLGGDLPWIEKEKTPQMRMEEARRRKNPEVKPEQPEVEPEQPEVKPEQPEVEPEKPEVEPEQPEVEPEQPEVEPEQPEVEPEEENKSDDEMETDILVQLDVSIMIIR